MYMYSHMICAHTQAAIQAQDQNAAEAQWAHVKACLTQTDSDTDLSTNLSIVADTKALLKRFMPSVK